MGTSLRARRVGGARRSRYQQLLPRASRSDEGLPSVLPSSADRSYFTRCPHCGVNRENSVLVCWGCDAVLSAVGLFGRSLSLAAPGKIPETAMAAVVHRGFARGPSVGSRGSSPGPAAAPSNAAAATGISGVRSPVSDDSPATDVSSAPQVADPVAPRSDPAVSSPRPRIVDPGAPRSRPAAPSPKPRIANPAALRSDPAVPSPKPRVADPVALHSGPALSSPKPQFADPVAFRSGPAVSSPVPLANEQAASLQTPAVDAAARNRLIVSAIVFVTLVGALTYLFFGPAINQMFDLDLARGSAARADGTGGFPDPRRPGPAIGSPADGPTRAADEALAAAERALGAQQGTLPAVEAEQPAAAHKDRRASGIVTPPPTPPTFTEAERGAARSAPRSANAAIARSTPKPASTDTARPLAGPAVPCTPNVAALGLCTGPTTQPKE
jgi:hypothetical protein